MTKPKTREKLGAAGIIFGDPTDFDANWKALMQVLDQDALLLGNNFGDVRVRMGLALLKSERKVLDAEIEKMGLSTNLVDEMEKCKN